MSHSTGYVSYTILYRSHTYASDEQWVGGCSIVLDLGQFNLPIHTLRCAEIVHSFISQILCRIASCLGGEVLLREFVPFFDQLSCDSMFHVRKAFAMCCKELSPALSVQQNEQYIVSTRTVRRLVRL